MNSFRRAIIKSPFKPVGPTFSRPLSTGKFLGSPEAMTTALIATRVVAATGGSIWMLSNFSYAGMRAQDLDENGKWRVASFVCGFPGTLCSFMCVKEGSQRAYGVDVPRKPYYKH